MMSSRQKQWVAVLGGAHRYTAEQLHAACQCGIALRSAGAAIFIGGEMAALSEFAGGWLCGCPYLGALESSGGITRELGRIAASVGTCWGSTVITASDPHHLASVICDRLDDVEITGTTADSHTIDDVVGVLAGVRA